MKYERRKIMNLLDKIKKAKELWVALLPHVQTPPDREIALWVSRFQPEMFEHAILRTSVRFRCTSTRPEPVVIWRYMSGVLANETRRRKVTV
jgi:hypothetical protein